MESSAAISGGTITSSGTIDIVGSDTIQGGATVDGGALSIAISATLLVAGTVSPVILDNVSVANFGTIHIDNAATFTLEATTITGGTITNDGTLEANGAIFIVDSSATISGSGSVLITGGGTADFMDAFNQNVTFSGAGTLELANPSAFHGTISGLTNSPSQVFDLIGYDTSTTASESYDSGTGDTTLTLTDAGHTTLIFTLAGDYTNTTWLDATDASHSGVDIYDPPPTGVSPAPAVESLATADGASGSVTFADADTSDTHTASFTPDGANYVGSFSLTPVTEGNGSVAVGFDFMSSNDQINLAPGETVTQSYNVTVADAQNPAQTQNQTVSVSIGGPGNDHFVFAPGIGADTITNFNPQQDMLELDHFANAQTIQELQSFITTDAHGDALINLGHNDSIVLNSRRDHAAIAADHPSRSHSPALRTGVQIFPFNPAVRCARPCRAWSSRRCRRRRKSRIVPGSSALVRRPCLEICYGSPAFRQP